MHIDLSGKTALVSGSTSGIGLAIAIGLARAGALTVVNGRSQQSVDNALAQIRDVVPNAKAEGVVSDLSNAEGSTRLIEARPSADILVNNAGIYGPKSFFDV